MIDKIKSLINPLVPIGIAIKGLEKINPKIKSFIGGATAAGYSTSEAMDFLRDQFGSPGQKQARSQNGNPNLRPDEQSAINRMEHEQGPEKFAKNAAVLGAGALGGSAAAALTGAASSLADSGNSEQASEATPDQNQPGGFQEFIRQNPELGAFLQKEIQGGTPPQDAAMKAKAVKKFRDAIADIEDSMGQSFEELLTQLFQGSKQQSQPKQQKSASPKMSEFMAALQQYQKLAGM